MPAEERKHSSRNAIPEAPMRQMVTSLATQPNEGHLTLNTTDGGMQDHNKRLCTLYRTYKHVRILGLTSNTEVRLLKKGDTQLVLKKIKKKRFPGESREMLKESIETLKDLHHPNLANIVDFYSDKRHYYLLSEFIEGEPLLKEVARGSTLDESTVALFIKQILSAMVHLHTKQILHRNLHFDHLLLEKSEGNAPKIKILDYLGGPTYKPEENFDC